MLACSSSSIQDSFTNDDANALADRIVTDLLASGLANKNTLLDCEPNETTQGPACSQGGSVRSKIVLTCKTPHPRECCAANPPSCKEWGAQNKGTIETKLDACKTSEPVTHDGTIKGEVSIEEQSTCAGDEVSIRVAVHLEGPFAASVNGRDDCPTGLDLNAQLFIVDQSTITLVGKICGRDVAIGKKISGS